MDKERPSQRDLEREFLCIAHMEAYQSEMLIELENLRAMGVAVAAHSKQRDVGKSIFQKLAAESRDAHGHERRHADFYR